MPSESNGQRLREPERAAWLFRSVKESARRLAEPHETQATWVAESGGAVDELALDLDDYLPAALAIPELFPERLRERLIVLDRQLERMSGSHHADLWTPVALAASDEWRMVRELAAEVATAFNAADAPDSGVP